MYNRKKKYTQKSSFAVESTEQSIYNLFYNIRFHSYDERFFEKKLEEVCETLNTTPKQITFQGCSLLFYSALYENSIIFKYLLSNYKNDFQDDVLKSIYHVYSNRDENILNIAMQHLDCPHEDLIQLLQTIAQNCFKEENIKVSNRHIQNWLEKNILTNDDILSFTSELITNNNTSYLLTSSTDEKWKSKIIKQISSHTEIISRLDMTEFYHRIISPEHKTTIVEDININDIDLRKFMSSTKQEIIINNEEQSILDCLKEQNKNQSKSHNFQDSENNLNSLSMKKTQQKKSTETNQPTITVKKRILQH